MDLIPGSGRFSREIETHSSIFAWEIPWSEEPGRSCKRAGHEWVTKISVARGFPGDRSGKEPACQCRCKRRGFDPGLGRSPGGGHDNPLQYSCLENPMDRGAWGATVHGVAESRTRSHNLLQRYLQTRPLCSVLCRNPGFLEVYVLPRISRSQMWKNVQIMGCLRGQFYPIQPISFLINPNNLPIPFTIHFPVVVV